MQNSLVFVLIYLSENKKKKVNFISKYKINVYSKYKFLLRQTNFIFQFTNGNNSIDSAVISMKV